LKSFSRLSTLGAGGISARCGCVVGHEGAGHAVVALEVAAGRGATCSAVMVLTVAAGKEQAPVAQRDGLGQRHADLLRIVQAALDAFW
jgi:hypothetical protein